MNIREYKTGDKEACLSIFRSNCPLYFDESEYELFDRWLHHQHSDDINYQSPTYTNSEKDAYYVIENADNMVIGCGGFYVLKNTKEARLAWGMVHSAFHGQGYGTALFNHRKFAIENEWPGYSITLGTSQHTYGFYEKMGLFVISMEKSGYGPDLDKYDMIGK
jgi:GNAT superfamily N-acetyltransferase